MGKLVEDAMNAGTLIATEGCLPSAVGARVRLSGGKVSVTDGPFTEAKEVVGGFAILKANSREEAVEMVKDFLKVAGDGECELRQLYEAGPNLRGEVTSSDTNRVIDAVWRIESSRL